MQATESPDNAARKMLSILSSYLRSLNMFYTSLWCPVYFWSCHFSSYDKNREKKPKNS